jgi:hypothetical protein
MESCPKCGSPRVHRSRARSALERLRKRLTEKRLHRCHDCGWRGWGLETQSRHDHDGLAIQHPAPDFSSLDAALPERPGSQSKPN